MPSIHPVRAWIAITTEEWQRFRALATIAGIDGSHFLAQLVRAELSRQGVQLTVEDIQAPDAQVRRSGRGATARKPATKPATTATTRRAPKGKGTWAPPGSPVRPTRRRKALPVASDADVAAEARAGARAARRPSSKKRGTIAVEGADRHEAAIAKANKRSSAGRKGRPTRRRSS